MARIFWNTLHFLMNSGKASMLVFVPKSVASWWSGAPSSIMLPYSSCVQHSNTMCSCVCSPALIRMDSWQVLVCCGFGSTH